MSEVVFCMSQSVFGLASQISSLSRTRIVSKGAHPIRTSQAKGKSRLLAVPLCVNHLNQLAAFGSEDAWWQVVSMDPAPIAQAMWRETLGLRSSVHPSFMPGPLRVPESDERDHLQGAFPGILPKFALTKTAAQHFFGDQLDKRKPRT